MQCGTRHLRSCGLWRRYRVVAVDVSVKYPEKEGWTNTVGSLAVG
jgi:hypothetical protein